MSGQERWKSLLEPRKLVFYFIFHGVHLALFAYGW